MNTLRRMIVRAFLPVFAVSQLFFILIIILVDLFANLWRYLQNGAALSSILLASWYYLPRAALYALPPALLFCVVFTLGNYQARNELIAVFASGVSLVRFTVPLMVFALLLCAGSFFFQEKVVISSWAVKREYSDTLMGRGGAENNTNIVILSGEGRFLYRADFFNAANNSLTGLTVIERGESGNFLRRVEADWAEFRGGFWNLYRVRSFIREGESAVLEKNTPVLSDESFSEPPGNFRRRVGSVDELTVREAREWIETLRKTGNDRYQEALTGYYERYAFALTPLIVTLLSVSISGYFRKNIMLMSLLSSLVISVVYYVGEMMLVLFARQGLLRPAIGAWGSAVVFLFISMFLLKKAKS